MNAQTNAGIVPPLYDVLMALKSEIFKGLRCCLVGKITAVDLDAMTADVQVGWLQKFNDGSEVAYPTLTSCPLITMYGGNVALNVPVKVGDECLVIIADRCIDQWLDSGESDTLPNMRMHDISDGFAIVGMNTLNNPMQSCMEDGEGGIGTRTELPTFAKVAVNGDTHKITISNTTKNLFTTLQTLLIAQQAMATALAADPGLQAATQTAAASAAAATTVAIADLTALLY